MPASSSVRRSWPSNTMRLPGSMRPGCWISRRIESAVTDLPHPDSPTMPSVSPAPIVEGDAVHRAGDAGAGVEVRAKIGDGEEGWLRHRAGSWRVFNASRKPSATRFTASTVMTSASAGGDGNPPR